MISLTHLNSIYKEDSKLLLLIVCFEKLVLLVDEQFRQSNNWYFKVVEGLGPSNETVY